MKKRLFQGKAVSAKKEDRDSPLPGLSERPFQWAALMMHSKT